MAKKISQVRIIGGSWKRTPLPVLDLPGLRPTPDRVRETLFNWLGQSLDGRTCLDLFAGTGAMSFEAASRGAQRVVCVEQAHAALSNIRNHVQQLNAHILEVVAGDALTLAQHWVRQGQRFDIIFLDPPFQQGWLEKIMPLAAQLISKHGVIYWESDSALTPSQAHTYALEIVRLARAGQVHYHLLRASK